MPVGAAMTRRLLAAWADRVTSDRLAAGVFMGADQAQPVAPTAVEGAVPDQRLEHPIPVAAVVAAAIANG